MSKKKLYILNGISALLFALSFLLTMFAKNHMETIERYYSRGFYAFFSSLLSNLSNLFPFSLGELVGFLLFLYILCRLILMIYRLFIGKYRDVIRFFTIIIFIISFNIFYYQIAWGLNNYRQDTKNLFELTDYETDEITLEDLEETYRWIIQETNKRRDLLEENENGIAIGLDLEQVLDKSYEGYEGLNSKYNFISPKRVVVKPLILSGHMNRSGYSGIYLYYVSEPNLNKYQPIYTIPYTACHEIAHQKGFAYEDDANYIGFLACKENDNLFIQYSGYYGVLKYVGNALYKNDPDSYYALHDMINEGVIRDLNYERNYWDMAVNEKAEEITDKINDTYLKANNQEEGILNYSKVVELIVLDYKARKGL